MSQLSPRAKKLARLKRKTSILKRNLKQISLAYGQDRFILLAALTQLGGDLTLVQGTLAQVSQQMKSLSYEVKPSTVNGEYLLHLIDNSTQTWDESIAAANARAADQDVVDA